MSNTPPLAKLSQWQQVTFCTALIERMLPNYQMFSDAAEFGEFTILRNQLDLVWQWLDKNNRCKININAQLAKLEQQTPDPQEFDFFAVFPALDTCMALMSLLQAIQDLEGEDVINVSRLSENSVSYYVELCLASEAGETDDVAITEDEIAQDPLMQWEWDTQQALFELIANAPENKQTINTAKQMVKEQGLSNLGLDVGSS